MENTLMTVCRYAGRYLESLPELPVGATTHLPDLRAGLSYALPPEGMPVAEVIAQLIRDSEGGIVHSAGSRFFGWVMGGHVPSALAADWLTSLWDQNAALYAAGPAAAVVEEVAGGWLKELLNIPAEASFAFTTGCQMAHFTCLAAARHALLRARGWNVEEQGLSGAPPLRVLTSQHLHASTVRAIRYLGLGTQAIQYLPSDEQGRLDPDALRTHLPANEQPTIVILQAGDVNTGTFDDFEALTDLAHRHGAWVHVDGAFGLWAAASATYRHLLKGCEKADSWATDGHKWLNVPYDSGYAFVRDPAAHSGALSIRASYLTHSGDARDQMDWTPEWSRRGRGFATYAAIRELGRSGIAALVENCCRMAGLLVAELGALQGVQVVSPAVINQALVRFIPAGKAPSPAETDAFTERVIARNLEKGTSFFGGTTWNGLRCMRISVSNWQTSPSDITRTVQTFREILAEYR